MKAAILYGQEQVRIEHVEPASLKPGEVRVEIQAALTCGTDLKVYRRGHHAKMIVPPAVFGHEFAGTICEIHPKTVGWKLGERVVVANSAPCGHCPMCHNGQENLCEDLMFLNGAYAQTIAVPARLVEKNTLRLKPATSYRDAALTEPLACVVLGVEDLQLRRGQEVLVLGAGPIGLMFVILARQAGCRVTVVGRSETRLGAARRLGAEMVLNVTAKPESVAAIRQRTGVQFDAVVEAVGQPEAWEAAAQLVRKGGRVNFFGGCAAGTRVSFDTGLLHYSGLTLLASFHHTPATIRRALQLIERRIVNADEFVNGECPLTDLPALFRTMAAGNRAVKTLIRVKD